MGDFITSRSNTRVKRLKSLDLKKNRVREGVFLLEGLRIIEQAMEAGVALEGIYASSSFCGTEIGEKQLSFYRSAGVEVTEVADEVFEDLSATVNGQGLIAVAPIPSWDLKSILESGASVLVIDRVQDPGNLGTMIRTADAAGFGAVICVKGTVDLYNDKAVRSTMGSLFSMPVQYLDEDSLEGMMKQYGYHLYAADLEAAQEFDHVDYQLHSALVIGNEGNGISDRIRSMSDTRVIIPIHGKAESLNAAIAAGILMYHMTGHIKSKSKPQ